MAGGDNEQAAGRACATQPESRINLNPESWQGQGQRPHGSELDSVSRRFSTKIRTGDPAWFRAREYHIVNVLAIDTSTLRAAVALWTCNGAILTIEPDPSRKHASGLLPAVRTLLESAGLTVQKLDGLAVGLGPGSFTGLRVGVAAFKTLAYATGVPLVGLDSLEVLARGAPEDARVVRVVGDAQRGEVFVADFARNQAGSPLSRLGPTRIEPRDVWIGRLEPGDVVLGPGLERPGPPLPSFVRSDPAWNQPAGEPLVRLAVEALESGRRDDPNQIEPWYLRRSAAEDQREART